MTDRFLSRGHTPDVTANYLFDRFFFRAHYFGDHKNAEACDVKPRRGGSSQIVEMQVALIPFRSGLGVLHGGRKAACRPGLLLPSFN